MVSAKEPYGSSLAAMIKNLYIRLYFYKSRVIAAKEPRLFERASLLWRSKIQGRSYKCLSLVRPADVCKLRHPTGLMSLSSAKEPYKRALWEEPYGIRKRDLLMSASWGILRVSCLSLVRPAHVSHVSLLYDLLMSLMSLSSVGCLNLQVIFHKRASH